MSTRPELIHLAASVDVEAVTRFLTARGWKAHSSNEGKLLRFEGPFADSGKPLLAVVPVSPTFEDYPKRITELATLVGIIEDRSPEDVLGEMASGASAVRGSNGTSASLAGLGGEMPFHACGYIGPQHIAAWKAMKWHDEIIRRVLIDFDRTPPEYVLVRAPAMGGKTTFAMQFMDYTTRNRPDILVAYLSLGRVRPAPADFNVAQEIHQTFRNRLSDLLESASFDAEQIASIHETLARWCNVTPTDIRELLRKMLEHLPTFFHRAILLIDDCESLQPEQREMAAEALRAIHAERGVGPLKRFSILVLARSLQRSPQIVSPLANVVTSYCLSDFTLDDVRAFIKRSEESLGGVTFEPPAVDYLYRRIGGQIAVVQRVCQATATRRESPGSVTMEDIIEGLSECYEKGGGVVSRLLNLHELDEDARYVLDDVLRGGPVLPFECQPAVAQLMDLGLTRRGANNRCVCRSPFVRELLMARYFKPRSLPRLPEFECRLATLPQVAALLCNETLAERVRERLKGECLGGYGAQNLERIAITTLSQQRIDLDVPGIRFFLRRYYPDIPSDSLGEEDILGLVAKVYIAWCRHDD